MEQPVPGVYLEYTPPQCPSVPVYTYTLELNLGHLSHTLMNTFALFFTYPEGVLPTETIFTLGFQNWFSTSVLFSLALFVCLFPHLCE